MESIKLLITIFTSIDAFYITKNIFSSSEMDSYCHNHCKSSSGTIFSNDEFLEVKKVITNTPNYWDNNNNIWIGLTASSFPKFEWSDNTSLFDTSFGNNIAGGIYPWLNDQPNGSGKQCVMMKSSLDYLWSDSRCQSMRKSLCNDCNSVLNKYIISTDMSPSPLLECESTFGTSLANLYTQRDYEEARTLCSIYGENCWINNQNVSDSDCSELDKASNFMLNNVDCNNNNNIHYTLCNVPSELCISLSQWAILNGDVIFTDCEMDVLEGNIVMTDKQWYNSNGILLIDYMFSIDFNASIDVGDSGIIIYESICDFYYISINGHNISITYEIENQQHNLISVPLKVDLSYEEY
eukprot:271403_1